MTKARLLKLSSLLLVVLVIYAGFNAFKEFRRRMSDQNELAQLKTEIATLENNNTELGNLIKYLQSPDFAEEEARTKLNLQKPGEHVIAIPRVAGATDQPAPANQPSNPTKWFNYFFDKNKK